MVGATVLGTIIGETDISVREIVLVWVRVVTIVDDFDTDVMVTTVAAISLSHLFGFLGKEGEEEWTSIYLGRLWLRK
jgi:hypothetical protein